MCAGSPPMQGHSLAGVGAGEMRGPGGWGEAEVLTWKVCSRGVSPRPRHNTRDQTGPPPPLAATLPTKEQLECDLFQNQGQDWLTDNRIHRDWGVGPLFYHKACPPLSKLIQKRLMKSHNPSYAESFARKVQDLIGKMSLIGSLVYFHKRLIHFQLLIK